MIEEIIKTPLSFNIFEYILSLWKKCMGCISSSKFNNYFLVKEKKNEEI